MGRMVVEAEAAMQDVRARSRSAARPCVGEVQGETLEGPLLLALITNSVSSNDI